MGLMRAFWEQRKDWSWTTFGGPACRGPIGPLRHLEKEVQEAIAKPYNREEYADLLFLVFDAAWRAGFGYHDLVEAAFRKLDVNQSREWQPGECGDDSPREHVRD